VISAPRLSFMWNAAMGLFGLAFWTYGILTVLMPVVFAPYGYLLAILGGLLAVFFFLTGWIAGDRNVDRAWDESTEHDSNRAYHFGFTVRGSCISCSGCSSPGAGSPMKQPSPRDGRLHRRILLPLHGSHRTERLV
jgi:hypothetical protein